MDTLIQLGSFVFQGLEVPEEINFGGTQRLIQHDLIGGNRVIDALGKSDIDIQWRGLMLGPDALTRAQELNLMRAQGQMLSLKWFNLNYNVVIQNFVSYTERFYQVRYEISLRVVSDGANPINTQNLVGFNEAINSDLTTATQISNNLNIFGVTSAITALTTAINAVPTFNGASPSTIATITTPLNNAISAVQQARVAIGVRLFGTTSS